MSRIALLLIAHGSRQEEANADLHRVAAELRARGHAVVEPAFLELAEPSIEAAGAACVGQGADVVALLPYFLSAGVHVRRALTAMRERLAEQFPGVRFVLADPLGPHPLLLDVLEERFRKAIAPGA